MAVELECISANDPTLAAWLFEDNLVFYHNVWELLGLPDPRLFNAKEPTWLAALHPDGLVFRSDSLDPEDRIYYLARIPQAQRPSLVLSLMQVAHAQGVADAIRGVADTIATNDGLFNALKEVVWRSSF